MVTGGPPLEREMQHRAPRHDDRRRLGTGEYELGEKGKQMD